MDQEKKNKMELQLYPIAIHTYSIKYTYIIEIFTCFTDAGKFVKVQRAEAFAVVCAIIYEASSELINPLGINVPPKISDRIEKETFEN